ncbi:uncharacterized protein LOC125051830 [Pieris napi]|uniref:uncharacterized protein LOC125051830 n=1 Tax=Pieris napi TaxID=78633 RepID=UPI001FBAFC83|nr:uncharacterized protein LOC125051830 [Pieris napi]
MLSNLGSFIIYCFIFSVSCSGTVSGAMTDEEVKAMFTKVILKCASKFKADMKDMMTLASLQTPTDPQVKCILACAYRDIGTMNDKGLYDLERAYKISEELQKGDEKRIQKGKELAKTCSLVNDETVTDGEKGCDRAALIFECSVKNAPKFGFKV